MAQANLPVDKVRQLQRALYVAAKKQPQRKFHALYDRIFRKDVLREAWKRVRANRGSAGVDGVTIRQVEEEVGIDNFLAEIETALREKRYRPQPVRRVYIPKPGKPGQKRPLGVPALSDRVVQAAARIVCEPIFEADFLPSSYGFRPKRTTHQALDAIRGALRRGYRVVVDLDIRSFFDHLDHERLMTLVARRISDRRVLKLIRQWLSAGAMEDGAIRTTAEGTPQGGVISPLLANVYLHELDRRWNGERPVPAVQVRFADDMVFLCGTRRQAETVMTWVRQVLTELGLAINEEKTRIADLRANEGFDFLGFHHHMAVPYSGDRRRLWPMRWPSTKAMKRIRENVRQTLKRAQAAGFPTDEAAREINPILRGWANYFKQGESFRKFRDVERYVHEALALYDNRRRKRHGFRWRQHGAEWCKTFDVYRPTTVYRRNNFECPT